jgi:hypothetical protein
MYQSNWVRFFVFGALIVGELVRVSYNVNARSIRDERPQGLLSVDRPDVGGDTGFGDPTPVTPPKSGPLLRNEDTGFGSPEPTTPPSRRPPIENR